MGRRRESTGERMNENLKHIHEKLGIYCKNSIFGGFSLKDYIEERAVEIGDYIIKTKATVRQTAKKFGISKSTVHIDVTKEAFL